MASLRLLPRRALPRLSARPVTPSHRYASTPSSTASSRLFPIRSGIYASVFVVSTGLFVSYYVDSRAAMHRYVIMPVLRTLLDAEASPRVDIVRDAEERDNEQFLDDFGMLYVITPPPSEVEGED